MKETIYDQACEKVYQSSYDNFCASYNELLDIIKGAKSANRDHKRVLCAEVNSWVQFLSGEQSNLYSFFYVDPEGKIVSEMPQLPAFSDSTLRNGEDYADR